MNSKPGGKQYPKGCAGAVWSNGKPSGKYCTGNGGKDSGFQWTRTDGGEKNVKYDNRK